MSFTLDCGQTALLIVDMQEKVFAAMDKGQEVLQSQLLLIQGFQILDLPIFLSEQYPAGLGETVLPLKELLGEAYHPWIKTTFSCLDDPGIYAVIQKLPHTQWVVVGIEAHICVLQTAKQLQQLGKEVAVLQEATASRKLEHWNMAMAEMRDCGIRITNVESVLFELIKDSKNQKFKLISRLIK